MTPPPPKPPPAGPGGGLIPVESMRDWRPDPETLAAVEAACGRTDGTAKPPTDGAAGVQRPAARN